MKRHLFALLALLLLVGTNQAQDSGRQSGTDSSLTYSTAVVSVDADGVVGGDFTSGFIPAERLDVVWIDAPEFGSVQYDSENQLVHYQPSLENTDQLDDFTIYAMDPGKSWNVTRVFFDPTSNELVFSTEILAGPFEGASFGQTSYCSFFHGGTYRRDGWTRFWGGVRLVGGVLETAGGVVVGVGTSWTGVGAVAGGGIAVHGVDNVQAGIRQLWSGEEVRNFTSHAVEGTAHHVFGVDEDRAVVIGELVDAGIGIASGVGTIAKGPQIADRFRHVFQLSAKTRVVTAGGGTLDDTLDISADVSKLIQLGGTINGGINVADGSLDLERFYSQLPDEFADAPKSLAGHANHVDGLPFGYKAKPFGRFVNRFDDEFRAAGFDDTDFFMQGSAASGKKFSGELLDAQRGIKPSDYDVAIVSPKILAKADELGINVLGGPLKPDQIAALGLTDAQMILSKASKGGIDVNFKIYRTIEDVYNYDKTIPFSLFRN